MKVYVQTGGKSWVPYLVPETRDKSGVVTPLFDGEMKKVGCFNAMIVGSEDEVVAYLSQQGFETCRFEFETTEGPAIGLAVTRGPLVAPGYLAAVNDAAGCAFAFLLCLGALAVFGWGVSRLLC